MYGASMTECAIWHTQIARKHLIHIQSTAHCWHRFPIFFNKLFGWRLLLLLHVERYIECVYSVFIQAELKSYLLKCYRWHSVKLSHKWIAFQMLNTTNVWIYASTKLNYSFEVWTRSDSIVIINEPNCVWLNLDRKKKCIEVRKSLKFIPFCNVSVIKFPFRNKLNAIGEQSEWWNKVFQFYLSLMVLRSISMSKVG